MKAIRIHQYGSNDNLRYEDVPLPEISTDDVLVKVYYAGVNPVDWKIREGYLQALIPYDLPFTLGWDVSGVVEAVGENVSNFKVGDEVYSRPDIARNGTYAEYVAIKNTELAFKPNTIDHAHAAGLPLAGLTAYQALFDIAKLEAGQSILIHAASGGVGSLAVQMAKIVGAHVIGTASAKNRDFLLEIGVDEFIDYQSKTLKRLFLMLMWSLIPWVAILKRNLWGSLKREGCWFLLLSNPRQKKQQNSISMLSFSLLILMQNN